MVKGVGVNVILGDNTDKLKEAHYMYVGNHRVSPLNPLLTKSLCVSQTMRVYQ